MKLDSIGNEIKFDATYGTTAAFVLILDGEPTMRIYCDMADTEKTIKIADADGNHVLETKGRFTTYTKLLEDGDGGPLGTEVRVDRKSVYGYILPRLHVMLGRLLRAAA
jgi:hypothetical protein